MSPHSQGTYWHLKDILRYDPDNWPANYVSEEIFDTKLNEMDYKYFDENIITNFDEITGTNY